MPPLSKPHAKPSYDLKSGLGYFGVCPVSSNGVRLTACVWLGGAGAIEPDALQAVSVNNETASMMVK